MANVTYYVALPFVLADGGESVAGEAREHQSATAAARDAKHMAGSYPGAVAFSRTGDPASGEFDDAMVIEAFGDVPSLDDLLSGS